MDGIGKVDNGSTIGDVDDVALRCEDKYIVWNEVRLDGLDDILDVIGVLLALEKLTDPGQTLFKLVAALDAQLVFPVGGN